MQKSPNAVLMLREKLGAENPAGELGFPQLQSRIGEGKKKDSLISACSKVVEICRTKASSTWF